MGLQKRDRERRGYCHWGSDGELSLEASGSDMLCRAKWLNVHGGRCVVVGWKQRFKFGCRLALPLQG